MTHAQLLGTGGSAVAENRIEAFRASFSGETIRPGDAAYDAARRVWNASIDKRPGMIARCSGMADVIAAVNFARENDLLVAIRGGGHNVGGRALCDGGLVIDLSRMKGILVDAAKRRARVQAGATLGDVDRETHVHGLAVPTGVISKTGIAGLTLGGGVGWLVRKYGLTCDNVLSFDLVRADGKPVVASATRNRDLFWALRGGGGNFGVVTSFEYRLHPVSTVLGGMVVHPRAAAADLLRFYRDLVGAAPEELTAYAVLMTTPDGVPAIAVAVCHCGNLGDGERELQPLRSFGAPLMDAIQPMPFPQMQSLLDGAFPSGYHNYWKSAFLPQLTDDAIDTIVEHANRAASPLTAIAIEYYGGAAGRLGLTDAAFAHRSAEYVVGMFAVWKDPAETATHIAWTRNLAAELERFASSANLLNYLGEDADRSAIEAVFGPNYERLQKVKRKYDPTNFFRVNQNIEPHR
jgi:FAD/FMN-containing dehydrogenase